MPQGWKVVQQRQTTDLTPDGRFLDIMEIMVETVEGVTFTLKVPVSAYSPETVAQLASARAAQISAVHNL
jgi:hypothetical protein